LNTWNWMKQRKLREQQGNSRKTEKHNSHTTEQASLLTVALPCSFLVSPVLTCFCDSVVPFDGMKGWWSC
jgi:hypothetical protein